MKKKILTVEGGGESGRTYCCCDLWLWERLQDFCIVMLNIYHAIATYTFTAIKTTKMCSAC